MYNEQNTESLTRQLMNFEVGKNTGFMVYAQTIDKNLGSEQKIVGSIRS